MIRKKAFSLFHDQVVVIQRSGTKYRMITPSPMCLQLYSVLLRKSEISERKTQFPICFHFFLFALSVVTHETLLLDFLTTKVCALEHSTLRVNFEHEFDETITM